MSGASSRKAVMQRLAAVSARTSTIGVSKFRADGTLTANTTSTRSNVAEYQVTSATALRQGEANPFHIAVPAYETATASGATPETFALGNDLIQSPITEDVVVFIDGVYSPGEIDAIDYAADEVDVNTSAGEEVDIFYIAGDGATIEVEKVAPQSQGSTSELVFEGNLSLIHQSDQAESPEHYSLRQSDLQPVIPTDWKLVVYVNAPYSVEWSVTRGSNEAQPVNALLGSPVRVAPTEIEGLPAEVRKDVAGR